MLLLFQSVLAFCQGKVLDCTRVIRCPIFLNTALSQALFFRAYSTVVSVHFHRGWTHLCEGIIYGYLLIIQNSHCCPNKLGPNFMCILKKDLNVL